MSKIQGLNTLAIGTAQFGFVYGIANQAGQVKPGEAKAILDFARTIDLDTLDTAVAYGDSESRLGACGVEGWKVISKLPALPAGTEGVSEWVRNQVQHSLARLQIKQLDAVLLHRADDALGDSGSLMRTALQELKTCKLTKSIGISIYDPQELECHWDLWRPDIVQAPLSVLDRRMLHSGWLEKLARAGVRIHVRSVFLQGLLLMPAAARPQYFDQWSTLLNRWFAWCEDNDIRPVDAATTFVRSLRQVERFVIGIDSLAQLRDIASASDSIADRCKLPDDLYSNDKGLIEPSRWPKK